MFVFRDSGAVCYQRDCILSADKSKANTSTLFSAVELRSDQGCLHLLSVTSGQIADCGFGVLLQNCCWGIHSAARSKA
jgi:hypothetical protein